ELKVTWEPTTRQLIDIGLPRATLVRTEDERWPYQGAYAVWQIGRWVSMFFGAGTLILAYVICLAIWPKNHTLAMATTSLFIFVPRLLFTYSVLSDDTALGFSLVLYLWLLLLFIQNSYQISLLSTTRQKLLLFSLGIAAGFVIVSKYTGIPIVVGGLLTIILVGQIQRSSLVTLLKATSMFVTGIALASSWWIIWILWYFNQVDQLGWFTGLVRPLLPGSTLDDNPTTARMTAFLSGESLASFGEAPNAGGTVLDWAAHTFTTYWGVTVFGAEPAWPYPYQLILGGLAIFCSLAFVGMWYVYQQTPKMSRLIWQSLLIHLLLFFPVPLLRFILSRRLNDAAQGRHILIPVGIIVAIFLMKGWLYWFRPQWQARVSLLTGGTLLIWAIGHLLYLWSAYPPPLPVRTTPSSQMVLEQSSDVQLGDTVQLQGYQTDIVDNRVLKIDLLWQSLAQAEEDYQTEVTFVDSQGEVQLRWLSQPAQGRFPMRAWQPGDLVRDTVYIPIVGLSADTYQVDLRLIGIHSAWPSLDQAPVQLSDATLNPAPATQVTLWQAEADAALTPYRYRSTIPVTLPEAAHVSLIGPAGQSYEPLSVGNGSRFNTFLVDHRWPSGQYKLQVDGQDTTLNPINVVNFDVRRDGWNFTPPELGTPVQANFADKIELLGYDLPIRRVEAGGGIPLLLYWRSLTQMREDYTIFVQLLDSNLERRGGYDRFPRETYNTFLWVPGEVVDDGFAVPVDANAPDGVYEIRIGLYEKANQQAGSLPLVQDGTPLEETSVVVGPIKVGKGPQDIVAAEASPTYFLDATLGDLIAVPGYELTQSDEALQITFYWHSLSQIDTDYTVFVHLRNQADETVAQADGPPVSGRYPTSLWEAGEFIPDMVTLTLPLELQTGVYQLFFGLYDPVTGIRLGVPDTADNSVFLTDIELNR
ncbi:MAG: hypothetical protein AAF485_08550, partial [Chloroflexota bacterium]